MAWGRGAGREVLRVLLLPAGFGFEMSMLTPVYHGNPVPNISSFPFCFLPRLLQGTYFGERESSGGRGPPPEGQGSIFGALMSVVGVVTLAGIVGVGGLWAWGKFHGGARQPGVRYMAANVDNDIGTELGPFGREYA